jgi:hypothetical protein
MEINLVTLLEMILQSLSPREASAKVEGDPYAQTTLQDIKDNPSQDYLPRQYRRITEFAANSPETINISSNPILQKMGSSAAYDPKEQQIYYNKDITVPAKNLQNPLVHELVHHLATYGKEPIVPFDEQHRLMEMFLGTNLYEPYDNLKGYRPKEGNLRDLETFEGMLKPPQKYYRTR